jgi:hypothetical protein
MLTRRTKSARVAAGIWLWAATAVAAVSAGGLQQLPGQAPAPMPAGTGLIAGRVIDAANGKPVPGVIVTLAASSAQGPSPASQYALVDADGAFVFTELPVAHYRLSTQKRGYINGSYGQKAPSGPYAPSIIDLADRERVTGVTISIWRQGAIEGAVLDEAGEPVVGVSVRSLRRTSIAGHARLVRGDSARTDDRGIYRLSALTPGNYVIFLPSSLTTLPLGVMEDYMASLSARGSPIDPLSSAISSATAFAGASITMPLGNEANQQIGDLVVQSPQGVAAPVVTAQGGRLSVYPAAFAPEQSGTGDMSTIALKSGDERTGVDLHVRLSQTFRVSGTLMGPDGLMPLTALRLVPARSADLPTEVGPEAAASLTDAKGAFTVLGVPPGPYVLRVLKSLQKPNELPTSPPPILWASEPVVVEDRDLSGVTVTVRPGLRVSGRLEFSGTREKPPGDAIAQVVLWLEPADNGTPNALRIPTLNHADASGKFMTPGNPAGRYVLNVNTRALAGWTLQSAMLGGKDISTGPLDLSGDVSGVVVTFTDRSTEISGTVVDRQGGRDADVVVLVFPADPRAWIDVGAMPRRLMAVRPMQAGSFAIAGLPPGEYCLIAVDSADTEEWQDPRRLEVLSRTAARVTLGDGDKRVIELRSGGRQ